MRRILLCLVLLTVFPTIFLIVASVLPKRYTATMGLLIDQTLRSPNVDNVYASMDDLTSFSRARSIQTQMAIISGTDVLISALELTRERLPNQFVRDEAPAEAYENLRTRLRLDTDKESDVVLVSVTQPNPELASTLANNVGQAYIDYSKSLADDTETAALTLIDNQIRDAESNLKRLDGGITALQTESRIVDFNADAGLKHRSVEELTSQLDQSRVTLTSLSQQLVTAEAILTGTPQYLTGSTTVVRNERFNNIDEAITLLRSQVSELESLYLPGNPTLDQAKERLRSLLADRKNMVANYKVGETKVANPNYQQQVGVVAGLKGQVAGQAKQVAGLEAALATRQLSLSSLPAAQAKIAFLQRQRAVYELGYQQLLLRKAVVRTSGVRKSNSRVVSEAITPVTPSFPDLRVFGVLGFAIGLMLSIFIIMPRNPRRPFIDEAAADADALDARRATALQNDSRAPIVPQDPPASN
jgi:uncharacterized protein involved in exopolysaccharide biosynthesis